MLPARTNEPYTVAKAALAEHWTGEAAAAQVVAWIFDALDADGDTTVRRDSHARSEAETMCSMVFADIGGQEGGCDYGAVVNNVLRACNA